MIISLKYDQSAECPTKSFQPTEHATSFLTITPAENWERYGFNNGIGFQAFEVPGGAPDYLNNPFACAPLGAGTYQYAVFSSCPVAADVNTMGGTSTLYSDAYGLWTSD